MLILFNGPKLTVSNICNAALEMHNYNIFKAKFILLKQEDFCLGGTWNINPNSTWAFFFLLLVLFLMVTSKSVEGSETDSNTFAHQCLEIPPSVQPCLLGTCTLPTVLLGQTLTGNCVTKPASTLWTQNLYKQERVRCAKYPWKGCPLNECSLQVPNLSIGPLDDIRTKSSPQMTLSWDVSEKLVVITCALQSSVVQAIYWLHAVYPLFCICMSLYLFHLRASTIFWVGFAVTF